jgi:hypothetical protein
MALHTAVDRTRAALVAAGVLLVAGAAVLEGCMQQRAPSPPGQAVQLRPGMGFFLSRDADEGWKLAYGQANSDNVRLMLECQPGSRKIDLFDLGHAAARKGEMLTLTSGKVQSAIAAGVEPDEAGGDRSVVIVHTTPDLPALDGFRHSGLLAVKLGSHEFALTASPAEKPEIARFFSGCEKR